MKKISLDLLKSYLAGVAIGLGGFLYCLSIFLLQNELGKIIGSLVFAIGLFLVCTFYLNLFTGKIGLIYEDRQKKSYYIFLPFMLLFNFLGAISLGYICYLIFKDNNEFMNIINTKVIASRLSLDGFYNYLELFVKSILCGTCVCFAVKLFASERLKFKGIFALIFFVFLFVYCGFQHCIANMFYFAFGNAYGEIETLFNLLVCILGNIIGPVIAVTVLKIMKNIK